MKDKYFVTLILSLIGIIFIILGVGFSVFVPPFLYNEATELEALPLVGVAYLMDSHPNDGLVAIEAILSDQNPTLYQDYLVYSVDEYRRGSIDKNDDDDDEWVEISRNTPPLLLAQPKGMVKIVNEDYKVNGQQHIITDGNTRYRGLTAGTAVFVVGFHLSRGENPELKANFIAIGTRDDYVAEQRKSAYFFDWFGWLFASVGILLCIIGIIILIWNI
ncbi:hypothetical protein QUF58_11110 [Anaerolineales bacterium HSG24]|nr:hypothetical protein [Anaerolineales bacterium HSG24]